MRKNLLVITITLLSLAAHAQIDNAAFRMQNVLEDKARNKSKYYSPATTQGSPYLNKLFTPAIVSGAGQTEMLRYEAYSDDMEFVTATRDTLALIKGEPFTSITFKLTNTKYNLVEYTRKNEKINGYLISVAEKNNFTLYKKQVVNFYKEKFANSGYENDTPARFERGADVYFIKDNDKEIVEFPSSKKALLKLYPAKKTEIEAFLKENKTDFDKEADLIKLLGFLAS
ncbi:hypothetical protein [Flavobacterium sp.]